MSAQTLTHRGPRERSPLAVLLATAMAWAIAIGAELSGRAYLFGHDHLVEGGKPFAVAVVLFVVSWLVMLTAMMLPSSLGILRAFRPLADAQPHPARVRTAFIGAYAILWSVFGLVAFCADALLHRTVDASPWLQAHAWLIPGSLLIGAGAFQFSRLKDLTLARCRAPEASLYRRYRPGPGPAFRVGLAQGAFCVGSCWALMLLAFAAGTGGLVWMALITTVMVVERSLSWGKAFVKPVGLWLIAAGALMLLPSVGVPTLLGRG